VEQFATEIEETTVQTPISPSGQSRTERLQLQEGHRTEQFAPSGEEAAVQPPAPPATEPTEEPGAQWLAPSSGGAVYQALAHAAWTAEELRAEQLVGSGEGRADQPPESPAAEIAEELWAEQRGGACPVAPAEDGAAHAEQRRSSNPTAGVFHYRTLKEIGGVAARAAQRGDSSPAGRVSRCGCKERLGLEFGARAAAVM
jgi:hypothetical protein